MTMTSNEAQTLLDKLEQTSSSSATLHGYQQTAPFFILWGIIWVLAYSLSDFLPRQQGWIWLSLNSIGATASVLISRRNNRLHQRKGNWRMVAAAVTLGIYALIMMVILSPHAGKTISIIIPLMVAVAYVLVGIWRGLRIAIIGIAIAGLSLFGFYAIEAHFNLWMALVGGGALILAGLWMRRV